MFSNILWILMKVYKNPKKVYQFFFYWIKRIVLWDCYYAVLREPKVEAAVPHTSTIEKELIKELKKNGFNIIDYKINVTDYRVYIKNAEYYKFKDYCAGGKRSSFIEKSLEHYLAVKLLNLSKEDVYIDIANCNSPSPEIYNKLYGCKVYRQDLTFPLGIHKNIIGGDACNMPIEDGFATKMALHCSFEHFEKDSDLKFIEEANRVLRENGKLCILPLYLFNEYAIQTDLSVLKKDDLFFEDEAIIYCAKGYRNRHGRFYDIPRFVNRIRNNLGNLNLDIYVVQNEKDVDTSCYVKFIALFRKE